MADDNHTIILVGPGNLALMIAALQQYAENRDSLISARAIALRTQLIECGQSEWPSIFGKKEA